MCKFKVPAEKIKTPDSLKLKQNWKRLVSLKLELKQNKKSLSLKLKQDLKKISQFVILYLLFVTEIYTELKRWFKVETEQFERAYIFMLGMAIL